MDMAILDLDKGEGSDVDGITGGVLGVVGGAEDATSGIGPVEGITGAKTLISVGISTCYGFSRCSGCGIFGCSSPTGAPGCAS